MSLDIQHIRSQFPILNREVNGQSLVYLDNGATSQKPKVVLDTLDTYYEKYNANVHRGIHTLSQEATDLMEESRRKIQAFINAKHDHEIIFTRGTTEGINLVSNVLRNVLTAEDEIIITEIEHHSNIVPWQLLCERTGAKLKYIPLTKEGILDITKLDDLLTDKTKLVCVNQVSNALGVVNPIEIIIQKAHEKGAWVLIDAAQSAPHTPIDVQKMDCDFLVFSGHKMYGPTGIGVLYGKEDILNALPPFHGGGEMIKDVTMEKSTYACLPFKFEAGTPDIAGIIGLGAAVDFINSIGIQTIHDYEKELVDYTIQRLSEFEEVEIYAKDAEHSGAVSFNLKFDGVHSSDVGMILDKKGIAVRTGHHCAQPIMQHFNIPGTVRASFAVYNTKAEIDTFIDGLKTAIRMLG
ncbi:cysteine desulfurase / selenocysteine lyase [Algoriella xinjiangensis]|uniref:Cysteine desulfurase n=1 Tax=Algoriella xinjiangensis TaxID=684065 RepID=A0A1I5A362_9FLAO|nr:cysteine desulfurase [Algoriella xinjiangensis]SFN56823.1 cysteine desulfurase / selenocysteine lyase [Algoriella xinjiangensis]VDH16413.1 Probable cysteine desulfurase [Algoriella xinjiangensis]